MREVPLLRVADGQEVHYGFTFGMGPIVRILAEYERGRKGKLAAVGAAVQSLIAVWSGWPREWQPLVSLMDANVCIDGEQVPFHRFSALLCSVTGSINLTVKPFARSRTPDAFYCLAYAVSGRELILGLPLLWRGYLPIDVKSLLNPISIWKQFFLSYFGKEFMLADPRYINKTAHQYRIESSEKLYTVDGEVIPTNGLAIDVEMGPRLRLAVSPTANLGPVLVAVAQIASLAPHRKKPE